MIFINTHPKLNNTTFTQKYSKATDLTQVQKINYQNEVAKSLVETTYKHLTDDLARCTVMFEVGADENQSIPTFQVKQVLLFPSCHLSSSLRKGTLLKGVLRVFSELTLNPWSPIP